MHAVWRSKFPQRGGQDLTAGELASTTAMSTGSLYADSPSSRSVPCPLPAAWSW